MTSSLVGSEMCIRDRMWQLRLLVGWMETSEAADKSFILNPMAQEVGPVSYTHLTLPTICSV
eukprot:5817115-Prorocentrum_lima.AAC.1